MIFEEAKYAKEKMNEVLRKKLILSKSLTKADMEALGLANDGREEDPCLPQEWFCSIQIGDWEEVEVIVHGNHQQPDDQFLLLAESIFAQFPRHLQQTFRYLKTFFPHLEAGEYKLSTVTIGHFFTFEGSRLPGFTLAFIYGEYPEAFQYKVKFKADGWPMGFEGGPL